jgi:hypothetical protein
MPWTRNACFAKVEQYYYDCIVLFGAAAAAAAVRV